MIYDLYFYILIFYIKRNYIYIIIYFTLSIITYIYLYLEMTYEIREPITINNNNIKLGKTFKYSLGENYYLTNIYYVNTTTATTSTTIISEKIEKKQDSIDDKTKLIIQSPLMYIPNSIIYFNEKPFLELSFNNEENDKDVSDFKTWITNLEAYIYKLIKKRSTLNIKKENMVSILKQKNINYANSSTKILIPINMNISKCILTDDSKKSKFLFNWEIPVPTYGISIIWIKNIWVKNGKWGINLFMYASRVMNSHILDPIDFLGFDDSETSNKTIKKYEVMKQFKEDEKMSIQVGQVPEYNMFFKMLKIGIPKPAIKQKIELSGLDIRIIDYPESTPYATVLHYISNPHLGPYVKSNTHTHTHTHSNTNNNNNNTSMTSNTIPNTMPNTQPNIKLDLLKNISLGGFKLKAVSNNNTSDDEKQKDKIKEKLLSKVNSNSLKVPTLNDIQGALLKLRKVEIDDSTI